MPAVPEAPPRNLWGLDRDRLVEVVGTLGLRPFHARQIQAWMYARGVLHPALWTDLPAAAREVLAREHVVDPGRLVPGDAAPDGTVKYRVGLAAGGAAECVYMAQGARVTLCVSSQVGCALACEFCLTGRMGLARHLDAGEIVGQVAGVARDRGLGTRPFNVVFMGMGEPLHNYDGVVAAVRLLADPGGFGLSRRRITVSTAGMAPAIERLATEAVRPRLAVSLNATTDETRDRLMPINRRYPLERLLAACRQWVERTRERFTFEYVLLRGVNDGDDDVERLAAIARRHRAKVNLIPFNAVPGWLPYLPPPDERVVEIRDRLLARRAPASIRWSRGRDARAACGQLAVLPELP